ncbi:MAG: glycogen synthase [Candidatus Nanopelagicales bacterium]|nr:glycogen synthase [Candidatus Nanopelagicales bacterium]MDZ4249438.1 glycogen synthase [Candidatus Nanopelagicales bacterium]
MRIGILTREWPPEIYGGAGVHVEHLVAELAKLADVQVQCFGAPRVDAMAYEPPSDMADDNFSLQTLAVDLRMASGAAGCDVVHSHTWYANMGGHIGALLHGIPHVISAHSLEPRRPWKEEQLGGGYRVSSWAERAAYAEADAIIAVSAGMRDDVLDCYPWIDPARVHVVHNGINTVEYSPVPEADALERNGVRTDRPYAIFVGRIARQKGLPHLLRAAERFEPGVGLVLCAAAPDTPELGREVAAQVSALKAKRGDDAVVWIQEQLPRPDVVQLLTHAAVFACPSIYEPLGIVNLEAMACETAVVASDVGGIPEVVDDEATGLLVHYDEKHPAEFESALAAAINRVVCDPALASTFGLAGRERAISKFGWDTIAHRTIDVYQQAIDG